MAADYDVALHSGISRLTMILFGALGVAFLTFLLVRFFGRLAGKGAPLIISSAVERAYFQLCLGSMVFAGGMLFMGVVGPAFYEYDQQVLPWLAGLVVFVATWGGIEYGFAWPGILVVPEAKGVRGAWRGASRESEVRDSPD